MFGTGIDEGDYQCLRMAVENYEPGDDISFSVSAAELIQREPVRVCFKCGLLAERRATRRQPAVQRYRWRSG